MSSGRRRHAALAAVLAVVIVMLGGTPSATPADKVLDDLLFDLQLVPLEGKTPAPFTLERLGDGQKVSLADHQGSPMFIYFWATWCPYCVKELPSTIAQVQREYKDQGLVVYAVNIEEGKRTVGSWVEKNKLTLPVLLDPPGDASGAYQVTATPTVYLIGRDGKLVAKALGTKPWTSEQGRALLSYLVKR